MQVSDEDIKKELLNLHSLLSKGWCQKSWAKTSSNEECSYSDEDATYFCIGGGILKLGNKLPVYQYLSNLSWSLYESLTLSEFNDSHSKEEVLNFINLGVNRLCQK